MKTSPELLIQAAALALYRRLRDDPDVRLRAVLIVRSGGLPAVEAYVADAESAGRLPRRSGGFEVLPRVCGPFTPRLCRS